MQIDGVPNLRSDIFRCRTLGDHPQLVETGQGILQLLVHVELGWAFKVIRLRARDDMDSRCRIVVTCDRHKGKDEMGDAARRHIALVSKIGAVCLKSIYLSLPVGPALHPTEGTGAGKRNNATREARY